MEVNIVSIVAVCGKQRADIVYLLNIMGIDGDAQFPEKAPAALGPIAAIGGQRQLGLHGRGHGIECALRHGLGAQYLHNGRMTPVLLIKQSDFFEFCQIRGEGRQYEPASFRALDAGLAQAVDDGSPVDRLVDDREKLEYGLLEGRQ